MGSEHSNTNVTYCLLIEGHMYMMRLPLTKGVTGAGRENIVGLMRMTILEGPAVDQSIDTDYVNFTGVVPLTTTHVMAMPMPESPSKQVCGTAVGMQLAGPKGP